MKPIEIESWALRILEKVEKHSPIEDSLVELKAVWPEAPKAARRIAGHANAARGENILWLIGVDEDAGIIGTNQQELSNWLSSIQSHFDGISPDLQTVNVDYKGKTIAALCFDTSRAPFVVNNPAFGKMAGGPVEWEVPWREGTKTRSANRNDLILLLSPLSKLPKVEILDAEMGINAVQILIKNEVTLSPAIHFKLTAYAILQDDVSATFPFHKCKAECFINGNQNIGRYANITMDTPKSRAKKYEGIRNIIGRRVSAIPTTHVNVQTGNDIIEVTDDEIVIRGTGKIIIEGDLIQKPTGDWPEIELRILLVEAITQSKIVLSCKLLKHEDKQGEMTWIYNETNKI